MQGGAVPVDQSGEGCLSVKLGAREGLRNEYVLRGLEERKGHFGLEKWQKLGGRKPTVGDLKLSGGEHPWVSNQRTDQSKRQWLDSDAPMLPEKRLFLCGDGRRLNVFDTRVTASHNIKIFQEDLSWKGVKDRCPPSSKSSTEIQSSCLLP